MKALITGASSGLGWDMAHILSERGYDIIAVARREDKLKKLKEELSTNVEVVICDVSDVNQCKELAKYAKEVDVFINNAGFGVFGEFCKNDLDTELKMLDTNIRAVHILTKLFLQEFKKRDSGYILNVASLASFFPGPLFAAYYGSKSYVLRITQAISEELSRAGSHVKISVLCPGPVHTGFASVANVNFGDGTEKTGVKIVLDSKTVSRYAIEKMFAGKLVIIPGALMRVSSFMRHIISDKILAKVIYLIQSKKCVIE